MITFLDVFLVEQNKNSNWHGTLNKVRYTNCATTKRCLLLEIQIPLKSKMHDLKIYILNIVYIYHYKTF